MLHIYSSNNKCRKWRQAKERSKAKRTIDLPITPPISQMMPPQIQDQMLYILQEIKLEEKELQVE